MSAKLLPSEGTDALDGARAVAIGKEQKLDLVFVGTVLEAESESKNKRGYLPSIKGQSASVDVRRVSGVVLLQGELYDVSSGARLWSERITGRSSNTAVGGTAYTTFGSWGSDSYDAFLSSPLGKALHGALADMVKKIVATRPAAKG